jgi:hypothetical protein
VGKVVKHFGVTLPFEQGGMQGFLKPSTQIEVDLDQPILPQIEKAVKVDNILMDFLVDVIDVAMARGAREYAPDDKDFNAAIDHIPSQLDLSEALQKVREACRAAGIDEDVPVGSTTG